LFYMHFAFFICKYIISSDFIAFWRFKFVYLHFGVINRSNFCRVLTLCFNLSFKLKQDFIPQIYSFVRVHAFLNSSVKNSVLTRLIYLHPNACTQCCQRRNPHTKVLLQTNKIIRICSVLTHSHIHTRFLHQI